MLMENPKKLSKIAKHHDAYKKMSVSKGIVIYSALIFYIFQALKQYY